MEPNVFKVGDTVKLKEEKKQIMKITSNIPGGGINTQDYLSTNKYRCEWAEDGNNHSKVYHGGELEIVDSD